MSVPMKAYSVQPTSPYLIIWSHIEIQLIALDLKGIRGGRLSQGHLLVFWDKKDCQWPRNSGVLLDCK